MTEHIRIARLRMQREPGMLYYVKADEQGWICVYKVLGGKKKKNEPVSSNKERIETSEQLQDENIL